MSGVLAWVPFVDPIPLGSWWWAALIPMAFLLGVGYKAVRARRMAFYWQEVVQMGSVVLIGLVGLGALSWLIVDVLVPLR